jgi:hypothetical protein
VPTHVVVRVVDEVGATRSPDHDGFPGGGGSLAQLLDYADEMDKASDD